MMVLVLVMTAPTTYRLHHFVRQVSGIIKYTQGVAATPAIMVAVVCITVTTKKKNMTCKLWKHPPPKHSSTFMSRRRRRRRTSKMMSCLRTRVSTQCNPSHGTCIASVSIIARGRFITRPHSFFTTTRVGCIMYIPSCPIRTPATMTTHHRTRPRHRPRHRHRTRPRDSPNRSTRFT